MDSHLRYTKRWIDNQPYKEKNYRDKSKVLDYFAWVPKIFLVLVFIAIIWSVYNQRAEIVGVFDGVKDDIKEEGAIGSLRDKGAIKPKIDIDELENKIHQLINEERTKQGLKQLSYDYHLVNIAREHSGDMAETGFFQPLQFKRRRSNK